MSLLNWELYEDHALVISDTLAIYAEDHRPRSMTTKVYVVAHLDTVICGTGLAQLPTKFYSRVVSDMVVRDIVHLNGYAPAALSQIYSDFGALPEGMTATVYTFGWAEAEKRYVGFAYRSTNAFVSERMPYGLGIKPHPPTATNLDEVTDFDAFVRLADLQKADDRARQRLERIGIGGDLLMYLLSRDDHGCSSFLIKRVKRFDDFESDWSLLLAKLPQNANHPLSRLLLSNDP